ncbi:hypothetical protein ScPMuIL_009604 [Solemya velum]
MAASMDNLFSREIVRNDEVCLKINQCEIGDVGCVVWDAAIVLAKYLETKDFDCGKKWKGARVVELGAGTGILGIMCASLGADVIITDLPEFLPLMQCNIKENIKKISGRISAEELTWGKGKMDVSFDFILVADCIYYDESLEPLVETIRSLCSQSSTVLCCHEQRTTGNKPELERKFFELMEKYFTKFKVPLESQDVQFRSDDIHIHQFHLIKNTST